jgi:hypothetical protein
MAYEISPIKKKQGTQYPTLVSSKNNLNQKPLAEKGINLVDFGEQKNTNNLVPLARIDEVGHSFTAAAINRNYARLGPQFAQMTENVSAAIQHAKNIGKFEEWGRWYHNAHDVSRGLSESHGISHDVASGIVAALSLGKTEWATNQENADKFITLSKSGVEVQPHHLSNTDTGQLDKAKEIFAGVRSPGDILGEKKGGNFFSNIVDPDKNRNIVTVDTQMSMLMEGWKRPWTGSGGGAPNLTNDRRYHFMAGIVGDAASQHGISPMEGQAVAWSGFKDITPLLPGTPTPHHPRFAEYYDTTDKRLPLRFRARD